MRTRDNSISVIILSKNNGETLENCIRSIINSRGYKEIIVVDAHSTDKTPEILEKYKEQIRVVYDEGRGIGIARNVGVEASSGDVICFVDADAFVSKNHFIEITRYLAENPDIGVVHAEGRIRTSENPTYIEKLGCTYKRTQPSAREWGRVVYGYFMAFRRKAFDDVGGFWSFPPFGADDGDFSIRVTDKGWKRGLIYAEGWHMCRRTTLGVLSEAWTMGKGNSCYDKKYLNHPYILRQKSRRKLYKVFRKHWIYIRLVTLFTPILALRQLFTCKSLGVYFYCIVSEWAGLFGYMWGWLTWAKKVEYARAC